MRQNTWMLALIAVMVMLLAGCMADLTGTAYSRGEARQVQTVRYGVVKELELVKIEGTQSGIGAATGAAVGGIAASDLGGGKGSTIYSIAGAIGAGLLGNWAEERLTRKQGVNITVQLDNGGYLSVVQEVDPAQNFAIGARVKVLDQGSATRVVLN
ncbi:hypothetical protein ACWJJH_15940 [Endozoicomonadaceae bacterium StTr2]